MTKTTTWMPLYIGDYLADTMHLTGAEHGAYLLLIMHYWRNGPLPDDDKTLCSIARISRKEWTADIGPAVRQFFTLENGALHQKRVDKELAKASDNSDKRRAAAHARWQQGQSKTDASASNMQSKRNDPRARDLHLHQEERTFSLRSNEPGGSREWDDLETVIRELTGLPAGNARKMAGKFVQQAGNDRSIVRAVLAEALDSRPIEPVSWVTAAIQSRANGREGLGDELAREFKFSIDDLPGDGLNGAGHGRKAGGNTQLAHAITTPDTPDAGAGDA